MSYAETIKKARMEAGLTQAELASRCGLATITIRQYESGKREPRTEKLRTIARELGIPVSRLWGLPEKYEESVDVALQTMEAFHDGKLKLLSRDEYDRLVAQQEATYRETAKLFVDSDNGRSIITEYDELNERGQQEAVKRVHELTRLEEYKRIEQAEMPTEPLAEAGTGKPSTEQEKPPAGQ